jgi:aspartyl-tRNA(Asn)/glutamyl-tRNA(Gln) amidotransferase subunit A
MLNLSLKQLAADLAAKKFSSVELTQFFLARIRQHNPTLNAFITVEEQKMHASAKATSRR